MNRPDAVPQPMSIQDKLRIISRTRYSYLWSGRPPPARPIMIVVDPDDSRIIADFLKTVDDPDFGRVLIRPTPGCRSIEEFALDVLTALGKNPLLPAPTRSQAWATARAWLSARRPIGLLVDRAHLLPADVLTAIAAVAGDLTAELYLLWSGPADLTGATEALTEAGRGVVVRDAKAFTKDDQLVPPWHSPTPPEAPNPMRPLLPTADFPLFLATCRRQLSDKAFAAVLGVYRPAYAATVTWLRDTRRAKPIEAGAEFAHAGPLAWWLRDHQLGPVRAGYEALITLRATQSALAAYSGILLIWDRVRLGPRPEHRLPSLANRSVVRALSGLPRPDDALAAIIALHLEQDASCFGCWTIGDLDQDTLTLRPATSHRHFTPKAGPRSVWKENQLHYAMTQLEIPCQHPVKLPAPEITGTILYAHLHRRRAAGARASDPLFDMSAALTPAIRRAVRHVDMQPWWLDRERIKARNLGPRTVRSSWLTERHLSIWPPHADFRLPLGPQEIQ